MAAPRFGRLGGPERGRRRRRWPVARQGRLLEERSLAGPSAVAGPRPGEGEELQRSPPRGR
eukprot:11800302-Alexandrium_andersonii.AAC.1